MPSGMIYAAVLIDSELRLHEFVPAVTSAEHLLSFAAAKDERQCLYYSLYKTRCCSPYGEGWARVGTPAVVLVL